MNDRFEVKCLDQFKTQKCSGYQMWKVPLYKAQKTRRKAGTFQGQSFLGRKSLHQVECQATVAFQIKQLKSWERLSAE